MNTPLRRLATVVTVMFLALMVGTTWVQFVQAPSLNSDQRNVRTLYREFGNFRGPIVAGGEAIVTSTPVDDSFGYQRSYANGLLYAPVTGYYSVVYGRTGIEEWFNTELNGSADSLFYERLQDLVTGRQTRGASVELTIDPTVQQAAWDALGDQRGAVVALDPTTGAILAMVSKPSYDPNVLSSHDLASVRTAWESLLADPGDPLVNRAIAGDTYPPGSTFKLITAAAALENGMTAQTPVAAPRELTLPQTSTVLRNFGGSACSSTGAMTLADALRISCNTAFAQIGIDLGADELRAQAEAFGFGSPLNVPMDVTESRFPTDPDAPQTALSAIGQYEVRVTPLQMAMVAAAIGNGGVQMTPYLVQAVRSQDLTVVDETDPSELGRPISATTATQLRDMMVGVVADGTGQRAQIPGVTVAGKTGTAQTTDDVAPHAWFTAFAPAEAPRVAVAVVVENGGSMGSEATGGAVAAPIARAVIEAALARTP
ncbi:peptidoglycan D,D-transpeptidase FtsI family protein [Actinotalea fermentans]|uniref:Cell division protein FtsI n=1 Tax=Actinotalea fermentans TaxID=43671 RepID=A0A511Z223_9CELL|nr:penicillin-binding transpeptidase domain-containing protein [Actinotalea fermentans]KGM15318.1 cell division protein FtsI [Actinotalea fermentans ATCC 43279 = JCM 9966 = DSM 3133]GEN81500.1 cell division protein FtsI [Actinotalea fermentans]